MSLNVKIAVLWFVSALLLNAEQLRRNVPNYSSRSTSSSSGCSVVDSDLASLYDVPTGALDRTIKRNIDRFPEEFCFQLTKRSLGA